MVSFSYYEEKWDRLHYTDCNTYDRILLFLVGCWELGDNLALYKVVLVHAPIVGFSLSLFKPDVERAQLPTFHTLQAGVKCHDLHAILSIDEVELIREVR